MGVPNEEYLIKKGSSWHAIEKSHYKTINDYCERYMDFLDYAKTERESVIAIEKLARENGFITLEELENEVKEKKLTDIAGKKVYSKYKEKNILLSIIGKTPLSKGFSIIASHIDSPRLDLKPNPLIETEKFAMLKTHYYGGIKKYHFANIPMALHGIIFKSNGEKLEIKLGEDPSDPVFTVNDILIHLAKNVQYDRKTPDVIKGEELNLLFSCIPQSEGDKDSLVKLKTLEILNQKYGITEEDLFSAELEAVPAGKSRHVGIDQSMIGAYAQDDRVCAYTSLSALFELDNVPEKTAIVFMADKEEIGSEGNSGMKGTFFPYALARLISLQEPYSDLVRMESCSNAKGLSADVCAAINPNFPTVLDHDNAARLGYGICLIKYTGKGGKYDASDANAEFLYHVRNILNENSIPWQSGELGKVDEGGGGTIAKYLARLGIDIVDAGPPLLSMHSSFEVSSKADVWVSKNAYLAFFKTV